MYRTVILSIFSVICLTLVSSVAMAIDLDSTAVKTQIDCESFLLREIASNTLDGNQLILQDVPLNERGNVLLNVSKVESEFGPSKLEVTIKAPINKTYQPVASFNPIVTNTREQCRAKGSLCQEVEEEDYRLDTHTFDVSTQGITTTCTIYIVRK